MISIGRYLKQRNIAASAGSADPGTLCNLSAALLESIARYVLTAESAADARAKLDELAQSLHPELTPSESLILQESVRTILHHYSAAQQDAATRTAVEMRHLVEILNQAVALMANGEQRSVEGLKKIHEALIETSKIPDLAGLKASLAETIRLAGGEADRQQAESARELAAFQTEITEARQLVARNPNQRLRGRPEGVRDITEGMRTIPPDHALYAVAFAFDRLNAVLQRYGPEVVEDVIFRLIRERLQPLASTNSAYRWTPQSLVGVFERPRDLSLLRAEAAALNQAPLVQRISLGNRTALLTLNPSHLVAEGRTGLPEVLIEEVDRFTSAHV